MARKIDEEANAMNAGSGSGKKKGGGKNARKNERTGNWTGNQQTGSSTAIETKPDTETANEIEVKVDVESDSQRYTLETETDPAIFTSSADEVIFANALAGETGPGAAPSGDESASSKKSKGDNKAGGKGSEESTQGIMTVGEQPFRVPRRDPLRQSVVPPEVVFFGEPRRPPPVEAARDEKYHGSLLFWARHATVAPRTSEERLATVFPKGRLCPESPKYRLNSEGLTYEAIVKGFEAVMDDLEKSKAFINSNIDIVPSKMFLRALTAQKLTAQSKNDIETMSRLKNIRSKYILANDQLFFPLNIEVQKAETRVMTYMAREELRDFARNWDEVEMSLHFTTLLAARMTWDDRVRTLLNEIKGKVITSVEYMQKNLQAELMNREFRKPGITAELYLNASLTIQQRMPELYNRVRPEIKFLNEIYFFSDESELRR
jgi:hypothetical protein